MRRNDREITSSEILTEILNECKVCRIAMQDAAGLYLLPMNFGYQLEHQDADKNGNLTLFFHCAKAGRKIDALHKNPNVAFEMDCGHELISGDTACKYGYSFKSIVGSGMVYFIENIEEKKAVLQILMQHQTGKNFLFDEKMANSVCVFKLIVAEFTAKKK